MAEKQTTSNEDSALVALEKTLISASEVSDNYQNALMTIQNKFVLAIKTASAVNQLRKIMNTGDVVRLLRGLAGTSLGFLTDKHHSEYSDQILADCATEAVLRGFDLTGNEFNVIAGRPYFTKVGLQRKVREFPGIDGTYDETLDLPEVLFTNEGKVRGAKVHCSAKWQLKTKQGSIERIYSIKGDKFTGADAYIGKAARKLARDVLAKLQGQETPEGEIDDLPPDERAARARQVYARVVAPTDQEALKPGDLKPAELENTTDEIPGLGLDVEPAAAGSAAPKLDEPKQTPPEKLRERIIALLGNEGILIEAMRIINPAVPAKIKSISDLSWAACDKYLNMSDASIIDMMNKAEEKKTQPTLEEAAAKTRKAREDDQTERDADPFI